MHHFCFQTFTFSTGKVLIPLPFLEQVLFLGILNRPWFLLQRKQHSGNFCLHVSVSFSKVLHRDFLILNNFFPLRCRLLFQNLFQSCFFGQNNILALLIIVSPMVHPCNRSIGLCWTSASARVSFKIAQILTLLVGRIGQLVSVPIKNIF